jgi:DNA (cytosine-5)-methyltransferase 1
MTRSISTVDLFCGAGGLTYGFEQAGLPVKAGYDIDPACKFPYEQNNKAKFILQDVANISGSDLAEHFSTSSIKVFSRMRSLVNHFQVIQDVTTIKSRSGSFCRDFARLVEECQPEIVSMENVLQLKHHSVFQEFIEKLEKLNYSFESYEVNCLDYGIPQSRKRLVLLASKFGKINLIPPTHHPERYKTVRQTIEHLEPLSAGQASTRDRLHQM